MELINAYAINDVVTHGGSAYRAIGATTNNIPPNATYWELLVGGLDFKGLADRYFIPG